MVLVDPVQLTLTQNISNFANATTGVNGSHTLLKPEVSSIVGVRSGELILLGGLEESNSTTASSGLRFLPRWLDSRNANESRTDLLVMLQVEVL